MNPNENLFLGFWRLHSFERKSEESSVYPFGLTPSGLLVYGNSGLMSVQLGSNPLPGFPTESAEPFDPYLEPAYGGEAKGSSWDAVNSVFDSFLAYYGHYTIDSEAGTVTHHVEASNRPAFRRRNLVRRYSFSGNLLILSPPVSNEMSAALVWEKV
jgi:hypothetical protein